MKGLIVVISSFFLFYIDIWELLSYHYSEFYSPYEYYGAAEPPVRCGESHLSGLTEPPHFVY